MELNKAVDINKLIEVLLKQTKELESMKKNE